MVPGTRKAPSIVVTAGLVDWFVICQFVGLERKFYTPGVPDGTGSCRRGAEMN